MEIDHMQFLENSLSRYLIGFSRSDKKDIFIDNYLENIARMKIMFSFLFCFLQINIINILFFCIMDSTYVEKSVLKTEFEIVRIESVLVPFPRPLRFYC